MPDGITDTTPRAAEWRTIGWNGVRLDVPASWQPEKIDRRRLVLEHGQQPVFELKWNPIQGTYSHARQFRRLISAQDRKAARTLKQAALPPEWADALAGYDLFGFEWRKAGAAGRGVIVYCPECRNAAIMQFLFSPDRDGDDTAIRVLRSYRDHGEPGGTLYSLFDIRARVPAGFTLVSQEFLAGRFELVFRSNTARLSLHRWSPASILLKNRDIRGFAMDLFGLRPGRFQAEDQDDDHVFFCRGEAPSEGKGLAVKFRRKHRQLLKVWRETAVNRILAVRLTSRDEPDEKILESICADYETIQTTRS